MNKTKSILKRALTLLLTLLMLISMSSVGISAAQVELAETGASLKGYIYYDNSLTQWSNVQILVGHSSYSIGYMMTRIANTNLWYYNMSSEWSGATQIAVFNASSTWGAESNSVSSRVQYMDQNSACKTFSTSYTSGLLLYGTSGSDGFTLSMSSKTYSSLNTAQKPYVYSAEAGSSSYAADANAGTVKVSGYYLSAATTAKTRSASSTLGTSSYASASLARGTTVTMTATAADGYSFVGWYNSSGTLQTSSETFTYTCSGSSASYYAYFDKEVSNHTVTFLDWDGTELDVQTVEDGAAATEPTPGGREGYTFTGWDTDFTNVTEDLIVTAQYTINEYTVTFVDYDGEVISTQTVTHGADATAPADPTRVDYTFSGWDTDFTNVTGDLTVTAQYVAIEYITITFEDYDGTVLSTATILAGSIPTEPADPTREGYTFTGWSPEVTNTTEDTTYTAQYEINTYTVKFVDYDGEVISTQTVDYGSAATAPDDPGRTGYTFTGWDVDFDEITADITVTATYTANTYSVNVTAGEGGTAASSASSVTYPETVTLTAEASSDYIFTGWTISGAYEVVDGTTASATFVIKPEGDITAQANFVVGQYLTIHSFSSSGYTNLTVTESNGTTDNTVLDDVVQLSTTDFNGVTWYTSDVMQLTNGYSSSVTATLSGTTSVDPTVTSNWYKNGKFLVADGYRTIVCTNNHGWSSVYAYAWNNSSGAYNSVWPGTTMTYAYTNDQSQKVYVMLIPDTYDMVIFNNGDGTQTNNTSMTSTAQGYWIDESYQTNTWSISTYEATTTASSSAIELSDVLYNSDGTWAGETEVWITESGEVTLRRDLLDLIEKMTEIYNGGENVMDYTDDSWSAFVTAYESACSVSGAAASTQTQIDEAETALQEAYENLQLNAYYTVTVDQNLAGTIVVGKTTITDTTGTAQVTQGSTATVTVTAPDGYYIASITGAISVSNQTSPYSTTLVVDSDSSFTVTYAENPTVTVTQDSGTVTVNGSASPVQVIYGSSAEVIITAPDLYYIASITVNGESVYTNTTESVTSYTHTLDNVTADTDVEITYAKRETYTITVGEYSETGGTLYVDGEALEYTGDIIEVVAGTSVTITATPNSGYGINYWLVDNTTGNRDLTYTFSNISENHTIRIEWKELQQVDVTIKSNPHSAATSTAVSGDLTATSNGTTTTITVEENSAVTLSAVVTDKCYEFLNWTIEGTYYDADETGRTDSTYNIKVSSNIVATANFALVNRKIYLKNDANWTQPYLYGWDDNNNPTTTDWPGDKMTYDSTLGYWVGYVPLDTTNIQFNSGSDANKVEFKDIGNENLYNNSTKTASTYVEAGYYLQGTWNGETFDGYDLIKFYQNIDGTYSIEITVTSTEDGYIYVNPTNENSHFWNAATADATDNPQILEASGAHTATPNQVKVEIDTTDYTKAYDVIFTFNPETGEFSWTKIENVPTITVIGSDGMGVTSADANMNTANDRVGDTYFDTETVNRTTEYQYYQSAQVVAGDSVIFYTQVNDNGTKGQYDYYVAGWVINGTEFVSAQSLGDGLYSGSYSFTEDNSTVVPVYFHTTDWLTTNNVSTVTVYAVTDKDIENWNKYFAAYVWCKNSSNTVVYEQFGAYPGQIMIPVAGLDGVYYTIVETTAPDGTGVSGILFDNYSSGDNIDTKPIVEYDGLQSYDYYEFMAMLEDGKENITFVIKDTNTNYNKEDVAENTNETLSNFQFEQFIDYSGLKIDIFGNNIEDIDAELSDDNALYIIQAGNSSYTTSTSDVLQGDFYVDCYIYDANGTYITKCASYELHDEDSAVWTLLADYELQRAYFSYETVNGARYDGEWYSDTDNTVTINLSVNVALTTDNGATYENNTTDPVNEADYGVGYVNISYQNVDVTRGTTVTLSATPKVGYKFIGWYTSAGSCFTTNSTVTVTAAIGTTYTAVFEKLAEGTFLVNHQIYQGVGTATYIPTAHGGNATLYVGIENTTQSTSTGLSAGNYATIEAQEGDVLIITIATDAVGADKFFAWYTDAVDKYGLTTYEEVGVDSDDNLYENNGTVVGRTDMVYFQFQYTVSDVFSMNLYSDLMPVSVDVSLVYQYNDRYGNVKNYVVSYTLTAEEIEGFAGNEYATYTPAYLSSADGEWVNTILANAPYIEDYYKDTTWVINSAMYNTLTFHLWATQPYTTYTVTAEINKQVIVSQVLYNTVLDIDARNYLDDASITGFWYNDVNNNGAYDKNVDIILTYGPQYGYRVTQDMSINYESVDSLDFNTALDSPVYGREQATDSNGTVTTDKIYVDYLVNILTPYFYGTDSEFTPWYDGAEVTDNWDGQHVTIESLIQAGYTVNHGILLEQVTSVTIGDDYASAVATATEKGFGTATDEELLKAFVEAGSNGWINGSGSTYGTLYSTNSYDITNKNRLLFTISFNNTEKNQNRFYNVYSYVTVTTPDNVTTTYISNVQTLNIYEIAVKDAVVNDNTTYA